MEPVTGAAAEGEVLGATAQPGRHARADASAAIYGSLLVTSLLAAQARADASPRFIGLTLVIGVAVFWLADVWTGLVALRVRGPITIAEAVEVARSQSPMLSAAVVPTIALVPAALGLTSGEQAVYAALALAIVQLFLWGLAVGRALGKGWPITLLVASVDCLLGLIIVALKVLVIH